MFGKNGAPRSREMVRTRCDALAGFHGAQWKYKYRWIMRGRLFVQGQQSLRTRTSNRRRLSAPLAGEVEPQTLSVDTDMYRGDHSFDDGLDSTRLSMPICTAATNL